MSDRELYQPTLWKNEDVITENLLNKIETGLTNIDLDLIRLKSDFINLKCPNYIESYNSTEQIQYNNAYGYNNISLTNSGSYTIFSTTSRLPMGMEPNKKYECHFSTDNNNINYRITFDSTTLDNPTVITVPTNATSFTVSLYNSSYYYQTGKVTIYITDYNVHNDLSVNEKLFHKFIKDTNQTVDFIDVHTIIINHKLNTNNGLIRRDIFIIQDNNNNTTVEEVRTLLDNLEQLKIISYIPKPGNNNPLKTTISYGVNQWQYEVE